MSQKISLDQLGYSLDCKQFYEEADEISDNNLQLKKLKKITLQVVHSRLTKRQREILVLYYFEKKNMTEIAEKLKVNKSTVSRTLNRAVANVKRYLEFYSLR